MRPSLGSVRRLLLVSAAAGVVMLLFAAAALAYTETYGNRTICGSPQGACYVQSSGAHTFISNVGASVGGATYLACQLFNSGGINVVGHGYATCYTSYPGGAYLWARVYNESAFSDYVSGTAHT